MTMEEKAFGMNLPILVDWLSCFWILLRRSSQLDMIIYFCRRFQQHGQTGLLLVCPSHGVFPSYHYFSLEFYTLYYDYLNNVYLPSPGSQIRGTQYRDNAASQSSLYPKSPA